VGRRAGHHARRHPLTAKLLRERGITVDEVDVSELQKAEAGVTCMSLISTSPDA
jgi:dimethylargininase